MAYEQKPNTFVLFKDKDDRVAERKQFYRDKGWNEESVPTYSGRFVLEDGKELNIEARIVEGKSGKFFAGRSWTKKVNPEAQAQSNNYSQPQKVDLDDDIPF
jgi:hypothetical protein